MKKVPNILTTIRLFLGGLFIISFSFHNVYGYVVSIALFSIASATDIYDGRLARKYKVESVFGKFFDPLADKIITAAAFIGMVASPYIFAPAWVVTLILTREFIVTGLRIIAMSEGKVIAASIWGKTKTIFQMLSINFIILFGLIKSYFIDFKFWPAFNIADFAITLSIIFIVFRELTKKKIRKV